MTTPHCLLRLSLLCLFATGLLRATEPAPAGTIAVTVRFLLWSDPVETTDTPTDLVAPTLPIWTFPSEKNRSVNVELTPAVATARLRYLGPEQLTFYRETPASRQGDPPLRMPMARATIPPDWTAVLFIVTAAPIGSSLPWQLFAVHDDEKGLPWENLRLHNLGRTPVFLRLGSREVTLSPDEAVLWPYLPTETGQPLLMAAEIEATPKRVFTGYLATIKDTRKQVFLLPAPGTPHLWRTVEIVEHR
jgi:hypothetical protein